MAVVTVELVGSRATNVSLDNPSQELAFTAFGSFQDDEVRAAVEANLPATLQLASTLFTQPITLVPQGYEIHQRGEGGPTWDGLARYGRRQMRQTGDLILSFDGTGGTAHLSTSRKTVASYGRPLNPGQTPLVYENAPDYQQAIGVNESSVDGVDIIIPTFKFTFTWYPASALMTPAYIIELMTLAGTVNADTWKGFPPNTVLFLGPTGQPRGLDDWEIAFQFIASPNADGSSGQNAKLSIGTIEPITKAGHDYLWIRFIDSTDQNTLIKVPQFAYVERVYEPADFARLGIGV